MQMIIFVQLHPYLKQLFFQWHTIHQVIKKYNYFLNFMMEQKHLIYSNTHSAIILQNHTSKIFYSSAYFFALVKISFLHLVV